MDVHQQVGERSFEYSREIVSARKPYKNYAETGDCHAGEESIVVAEIAFPPNGRPLFSVHGSHSPTATFRLSRQELLR